MTLPESMANVVDNLQSKVNLKYLDIRTWLLELALFSIVDTLKKNKAVSAKSRAKNEQWTIYQQANPTRVRNLTVLPKGNQCSWCKSRNFPFNGYTFKSCQKLKDYQVSSSSSQQQRPIQTTGYEVVPYWVSSTQELFSFNCLAHLVISRPSSHSASVNVPTQVSTNHTIYKVWTFDTSASFHITTDFSHLPNPVYCHVGLTVGGGKVIHAMYQENMVLSLQVPTSILSLTLIDVLYMPDWNKVCSSAQKIVHYNMPPVFAMPSSYYVHSLCCQRLSSLCLFSITLYTHFALQCSTSDPVHWLYLLCLMSNLNYLTLWLLLAIADIQRLSLAMPYIDWLSKTSSLISLARYYLADVEISLPNTGIYSVIPHLISHRIANNSYRSCLYIAILDPA